MRQRRKHLAPRARAWTGAILPLLLLTLCAPRGFAGQIIPSLGVSKPVEGDGSAKLFEGLAIRGSLLPVLMTEIGVGYRHEQRSGDQLKIRQWPITASLYVVPGSSVVYAGGGAGWYHTSYDYKDNSVFRDETKQQFGVHLGGGFQVPLGSRAGIDVNARYVMMRDQNSHLIPQKFNPDFWTTSFGLAIKY